MRNETKEIIRRFLRELPATSNGRIERIVGCDVKVVSQIRRELLDSGEIPRAEVDEDKEGDI